jgi:protein phosphatase
MVANGKVFAVADGMGGHFGGEVASKIVVDFLTKLESFAGKQGLFEAVKEANVAVFEHSLTTPELSGMGTTLTMLVPFEADDEFDRDLIEILSVGDSRAYLLHDLDLIQVTEDHTYVGELLRSGRISVQDASMHRAKHVLTRAVGVEPDIEVDLWEIEPHVGDVILLCSDGLTNELVEPQIRKALIEHADPQLAAQELVSMAKKSGGSDNITVVVVRVLETTSVASVVGATSGRGIESIAPRDRKGVKSDEGRPKTPLSRISISTNTKRTEVTAIPTPLPRREVQRSSLVLKILRTTLFVLAVAVVAAVVAGVVDLYAKNSYYVGTSGKYVAIYQGRKGGVLWFDPKLVRVTSVAVSSVNQARQVELNSGVVEPSLNAANLFISNLMSEVNSQKQFQSSPTTVGSG